MCCSCVCDVDGVCLCDVKTEKCRASNEKNKV